MEKERLKKPLNFVDIHGIKKFLLIVFSMKGREQSVFCPGHGSVIK